MIYQKTTTANSKKTIFITLFIIVPILSFSQIDLEKLSNVKLGESFDISKIAIKAMFTKNAEIYKADFLGACRIEYDNVDFNYYGNANYTFQYVKNILTCVKIEFSFEVKDTSKFRRFYNTFISDIKNSYSNKLYKTYEDLLEKDEMFSYIKDNCIINTNEEDSNYKKIKTKNFGQSFWGIYDKSKHSNKYLRFYVSLNERHFISEGYGITKKYDGGVVQAMIEFSNEKFHDLKVQEENCEDLEYHNLNDRKE